MKKTAHHEGVHRVTRVFADTLGVFVAGQDLAARDDCVSPLSSSADLSHQTGGVDTLGIPGGGKRVC